MLPLVRMRPMKMHFLGIRYLLTQLCILLRHRLFLPYWNKLDSSSHIFVWWLEILLRTFFSWNELFFPLKWEQDVVISPIVWFLFGTLFIASYLALYLVPGFISNVNLLIGVILSVQWGFISILFVTNFFITNLNLLVF